MSLLAHCAAKAAALSVRKMQSENLTRHLLAHAADSDLGWLYIDGRRNVITRMHKRGAAGSDSGWHWQISEGPISKRRSAIQ